MLKRFTSQISLILTITMILSALMPISSYASSEPVVRKLGSTTVFEKSTNTQLGGDYSIMTGNNYLKTKINIPEDGIYSLDFTYTSTGVGFGITISIGDETPFDDVTIFRHENNTGGSIGSAYATTQTLGNVTLTAGEHIFTVATPSRNAGSMVAVRTITLTKQEIPFEKIVQPLNNTVTTETDCGAAYITDTHYLLMSNKYVSVPITVNEAGTYSFSLKHVTPGIGMSISVSVDDEVQINKKILTKHPDNPGNYDNSYVIEENLGEVNLKFGTNIIKLSTPSTNGGSGVRAMHFTIDIPESEKPTLEPTEEPTEAPADIPTEAPTPAPTATPEPTNVPVLSITDKTVVALNSTNKNLVPSESKASPNTTYTQLGGGGSVSVPVMAESEGAYSITLKKLVAGPSLRMSVNVNGSAQLSGIIINHEGNTSYSSSYIREQKLGNIELKKGLNTVTVQAATGNGGTPIFVYELTFERPQEIEIKDFSLNNASGGRMVYSTREGLGITADITLKKYGNLSPVYMLVCAAYDKNGGLSKINTFDIDCGLFADGETKVFKTPLTLSGDEKAVKAIIMEKETLKPLASAKYVNTLPLIEDDLLNSEVSYKLATETLNNDGAYYDDYSLHTETYDIDAIFYEGYNDTKVFAYLGYPKNATEDNKVPAMVLLHGGLGKAERYWVENWNKLGFAAIAMDLYGRGPEKDSSTSSGQKQHPYAGVSPYAVPSSFLADIKNAGMYQNIVAVINAHNILRDSGKVDIDNIGITGISWGGVTTTTVIGIDNRFKFAAPVYGCGFLDKSRTYFSSAFSDSTATILWDPANFAAKADIPVLYVNGDTDANFSINATSLTKGVTKNSRMSIIHNFPHDQVYGSSVDLVYAFAQNMVKDTDPFITITEEYAKDGTFTAVCDTPEGAELTSAVMYYITTDELAFGGGKDVIGWQTVSDFTISENTVTAALPEDATYAYMSITDNHGYTMSTRFIDVR